MTRWVETHEPRYCRFCGKKVPIIGQHLFLVHKQQWKRFREELRDLDDEVWRLQTRERE